MYVKEVIIQPEVLEYMDKKNIKDLKIENEPRSFC